MKSRLSVEKLESKSNVLSIIRQSISFAPNDEVEPKGMVGSFKAIQREYRGWKTDVRDKPTLAIVDLVFDEHKCNIAIVQHGIQDPDYFAEYNAFYSRQFQRVRQTCTRVALLHNPSGRPPANTDVSGLVDCLDESEQGPLPHDQLVRVQP